jgi:hypothetical protein
MYAELAHENYALKDLIEKNVWSAPGLQERDWRGESGSAQMYPACCWNIVLAMMEIRTRLA